MALLSSIGLVIALGSKYHDNTGYVCVVYGSIKIGWVGFNWVLVNLMVKLQMMNLEVASVYLKMAIL